MFLTPLLNRCFYKCHVPLAVMSGPGRGKTAMIQEWCKTNDIPLVQIPTPAVNKRWILGLPVADGDQTVVVPPEWAKTLKDRGVLFFDELDAASDEVQGAVRELAEFRRFPNGEKLGDGVLIVAALNPPEISGGHILPALKRLFMWCQLPQSSAKEALAWITGQKDEFDGLRAPAKYVGKSEWLERFRGNPDFEEDKKALLKKANEMGMEFTPAQGAAGNGLVNCPQTMENLVYWANTAEDMARWAAAFIDDESAAILVAAWEAMTGKKLEAVSDGGEGAGA